MPRIFFAAFLAYFAGNNSIHRIAQIGSGQAIDGLTILVLQLNPPTTGSKLQGWIVYPRGFHQSVAIIESSVVQHQSDFGWRATAVMYLAQYLFLGIFLIHSASYLMSAIRAKFKAKERDGKWIDHSFSVVFGLSMALFVYCHSFSMVS